MLLLTHFDSLFNYCLLIWTLHSCQNNSKIHNNKLSSFEYLQEKDGSISVHYRNIQSLTIEMLQIKHGLSRKTIQFETKLTF